ncbi:MAG: CaiB/BaiF CoA transferase family protein [Promethearchaeota archaeon]|jgi:formyl-CoA transferase
MLGILDGILVLDFSEYIAGPYCGFLLADLGAEVIKIEPPDGSEERRWGRWERYKGNTRMALSVNRGKKSLCLDVRKEEAKKVIYRMVEKADIVIQNYTPGVAKRLGIDYDTLSAINKGLIFISSTAFGEVGPYKTRKGFDIIAHAASGMMAAYSDEEGKPRGPGGSPFIDIGTGMLNAFSAVSALFNRTRTGEGQKIETSLFCTGMALRAAGFAKIENLDKEKHQEELEILNNAFRHGKTHTEIIDELAYLRLRYEMPKSTRILEVPDCNHRPADRYSLPYYRVYETANGFMSIAALTTRQRKDMCEVIGIYEKGAGIPFSQINDDVIYNNQLGMKETFEKRFREKTTEEWIETLEKVGVPCGPVNYSANLFYDPQVKALNMIWDLENSKLGPYQIIGHPIKFTKNPVKPGKGAPTLGEDSISILEHFGFTTDEIEEFKNKVIIK